MSMKVGGKTDSDKDRDNIDITMGTIIEVFGCEIKRKERES